jgi:hypothetical protein
MLRFFSMLSMVFLALFFFGPSSPLDGSLQQSIKGKQVGPFPTPASPPCLDSISSYTSAKCTGPGTCTSMADIDYSWALFGSENYIAVPAAGCGALGCGGGGTAEVLSRACNWNF